MHEKVFSNPDIYKIYIPLPNNPLLNLNCYVVKTPDENMIVDTGFNMPECLDALREGLKELDIDIKKSSLFLTHLHSDHTGLAPHIMDEVTAIYMSESDHEYLINSSWDITEEQFLTEGFPADQIDILRRSNPARAYAPPSDFDVTVVEDQDKIQIGPYTFTCVLTPGHTPGHMCIYYEKEKIMFLGDHVLFDITPNITTWNGVYTSLRDYLSSLKKIASFDMKLSLPAHRKHEIDIYERIKEIQEHHDERLRNTIAIINEHPNLHCYDIAGKMQWSMQGRDWTEFPMHQKWFAVGETIAHLEYLLDDNKIKYEINDGIKYYTLKN